jgi:hypothetical protein
MYSDKQKIAILIEALQLVRMGKRNEIDRNIASNALDRICSKRNELVKTGLSQIKTQVELECLNGEAMFNIDYRQYEFAVQTLVNFGWKAPN